MLWLKGIAPGFTPATLMAGDEKLWAQPALLPQTHLPTLALALLSLLIVIFSPKVAALKKIPGPLVAMIVATLLQSTLQLQGIANMMTPLFGGFAATGAIARTATNIRNSFCCGLEHERAPSL